MSQIVAGDACAPIAARRQGVRVEPSLCAAFGFARASVGLCARWNDVVPWRMRGATLLELLSVLAIVGIMTAMLLPPASRAFDRAEVRAAADRYAIVFEAARGLAVDQGRFSRVEVDTARVEVALLLADTVGAFTTLRTWQLGAVSVRTSQPVVAFSPLGMGWGASNTRLVFARAAAAETLTVSRTGRLRRS